MKGRAQVPLQTAEPLRHVISVTAAPFFACFVFLNWCSAKELRALATHEAWLPRVISKQLIKFPCHLDLLRKYFPCCLGWHNPALPSQRTVS